MKKIIVAVAAAALFSAAFADEAFDKLVSTANTPKTQLTSANATEVFDAAIATTNITAIKNLVGLKLVSFADVFAKTKGKFAFAYAQAQIAQVHATEAERADAFNDAIDLFIAEQPEFQAKMLYALCMYSVYDYKNGGFMTKTAPDAVAAACEKLAKSSAQYKEAAIANVIYCWGFKNYSNVSELAAAYKDSVVSALLRDFLKVKRSTILDVAQYCKNTKDYDNAKKLIADPNAFGDTGMLKAESVPFLNQQNKELDPVISAVRKQFIAEMSENEKAIISLAVVQDKVDGNKETTATLAWPRLKNPANKIEVALYLNDVDKVIDTLIAVDNTLDADSINSAITVINALDPDYRAADVLKALRVVNKKYTLKLYDDRDTWEPALSKVRALIDTYNN